MPSSSSRAAKFTNKRKRDILNDPRMAEHKVALDKIVEVTSQYLSDEDFNGATSSKLEEALKSVEEMKGQLRHHGSTQHQNFNREY
jgi:hypothetical protein